MTNLDLLDSIGNAKGAYILQAQQHRRSKPAPAPKRLNLKRTWLIAAIIALMLLLVGCVAYVLSLEDLIFGETVRENIYGEKEISSVISVQGFVGTPGYQASKEWYEWDQTYDPDNTIMFSEEAYSVDYGDEYQAYHIYSQEMKDKIDEICEKYDLELLGPSHIDCDIRNTFRSMGITDILKPGAQVEADHIDRSNSHTFYENGTLSIYSTLKLTGENNPWPYETGLSYWCGRKDTFSIYYETVGPLGSYDEWVYTTSDGIDVLMVLQKESIYGPSAFMLVDRGEYIFLISGIETHTGNILDGEYDMNRAGLEAIAEVFDFTIQPQRVSKEEAEAADQRYLDYVTPSQEEIDRYQKEFDEYYGAASYKERVKFHLTNSSSAERLGYLFRDMDGDGNAELLIGMDGYINFMYTEKDGMAKEIFGPLNQGLVYLTEDNYLIDIPGDSKIFDDTVRFLKFVDGELITEKHLRHNSYFESDGSPWQIITPPASNTPITEAEYNEIINSQKRVVLEMLPLTEYPLDEEVTMKNVDRNAYFSPVGENFNDLARNAIINPSEGRPGEPINYRFALIDLDGDGIDELLWDQEYYTAILSERSGELYCIFSGKNVRLCKDNIIEIVHEYSGNNKTYCYYKIVNGKGVNVDYLRYDEDLDPSNPWFRSMDATGQDTSLVPISQAEFQSILNSYPSMDLPLSPVSEYPLN